MPKLFARWARLLPRRYRHRAEFGLGLGTGRAKGAGRNNLAILGADPPRLASLLVGHVPTGMLPPRASPAGRLDADPWRRYFDQRPKRGSSGDGRQRLWASITSPSAGRSRGGGPRVMRGHRHSSAGARSREPSSRMTDASTMMTALVTPRQGSHPAPSVDTVRARGSLACAHRALGSRGWPDRPAAWGSAPPQCASRHARPLRPHRRKSPPLPRRPRPLAWPIGHDQRGEGCHPCGGDNLVVAN